MRYLPLFWFITRFFRTEWLTGVGSFRLCWSVTTLCVVITESLSAPLIEPVVVIMEVDGVGLVAGWAVMLPRAIFKILA